MCKLHSLLSMNNVFLQHVQLHIQNRCNSDPVLREVAQNDRLGIHNTWAGQILLQVGHLISVVSMLVQ
jgi:hypothetical protein